ncbi:MAG: NAD(P)-binding protein, partial [Methanobacterium sp.]
MDFDVVIIGAGPAGLFAASKLADHLKVIIIDKGRGLEGRKCSSLQDGKCTKCFPCNITGGLGGAGGLSDGKLNLRPDIGGNLEEFVSHDDAWKIINDIDKFFLKHGAPDELYAPGEDDIDEILRKSAASGIK